MIRQAVVDAPVWFGKYRLLERIALGGMAEVFLAVRPGVEGFEKQLAIKRIRPHLAGEEAFVRMFLHEARLAACLQHPNIVQIYDLGQIGRDYYIAMEHVAGRDMSRVVPKAESLGIPFPLEYSLYVAASALDGLSYAHTKRDDDGYPLRIVHRDMTPENIMVSWSGNVKILDFGIAKASNQTDHTKTGEIKGKLSYMSPEQAMGQTLDARSDIFTMGVVLYEWLTGYKLFTGENEMAVLKSIVESRIYTPSYFREDIPEDLESIHMKALEKDREARYQSAREMQLEIQRWLHASDFTPSPVHLSNFMKQIFVDEVKAEDKRRGMAKKLLKGPPPLPKSSELPAAQKPVERDDLPSGLLDDPRALALEAAPPNPKPRPEAPRMKSSGPPRRAVRSLEVELDIESWERLERACRRSGVGLDELVRDLLQAHTRYL